MKAVLSDYLDKFFFNKKFINSLSTVSGWAVQLMKGETIMWFLWKLITNLFVFRYATVNGFTTVL